MNQIQVYDKQRNIMFNFELFPPIITIHIKARSIINKKLLRKEHITKSNNCLFFSIFNKLM